MNGLPKKLGMFESATLRLTAWYTALVMLLSLLFSVVLYGVATNEFGRALGPMRPGEIRMFLTDDDAQRVRTKRLEESSNRLIVSLLVFNLAVLAGGSVLSYWLARRTLRPIQHAHEAQVQFASDAAHELRTPLAVMQTEIEVGLRDKHASTAGHAATLRSNLEEIGRLRTLTDLLLQLASLQELPRDTVSVEAVVETALAHVQPLAASKQITLESSKMPYEVVAHFDSLADLLTILFDNALKYSPAHSRVMVDATATDKWVELSVADQGIGIAEHDQAKIFERFYRTDESRSKENSDGYGLGLSLAQRLCEEMKGALWVKSRLGQGSTFTVKLPRKVV